MVGQPFLVLAVFKILKKWAPIVGHALIQNFFLFADWPSVAGMLSFFGGKHNITRNLII